MKALGIDAGNGSISLAVVENRTLIYWDYELHKGQPAKTLQKMLKRFLQNCPGKIAYAMINSKGAWLYESLPEEAKADRITALLAGRALLFPRAESIIDIGAQTSSYVTGFGENRIPEYAINGECAAGTGAFFEDQMYRLGVPLEQYSEYVKRAQSVPRLAGRCSVFAKTDLIHRQQEGVSTEDILLGLAYAVIRNYKAAVVGKHVVEKPVILTGGVVKNEGVIRAIKDIFSLDETELICEETGMVLSAAGLATLALERRVCFDWEQIKETRKGTKEERRLTVFPGSRDKLHPSRMLREHENMWVGVDVGSTSTNLVLIGEDKSIVDYQYLRTRGNPQKAVDLGIENWKRKYGGRFVPAGYGVTGSGRYLVAAELQADTVVDEITAQAGAAVFLYPDTETIFEIGGQDSKYISLKNGQVVDFEMNKVCAAGTGSFIEEQANRMGIPLDKIGSSALDSKEMVELGERCTVLMESQIAGELAKGTSRENLCAGLCRSVVRNYLNRVVGNKRIGNVICLQGGVMHNEGIVAAFYEKFGDRIRILPHYDVSGAYGAALEASRQQESGGIFHEENTKVYEKNQKWFLAGYDGTLKAGRETIGIPRALMIYKFFPMAYKYFTSLGFNVLLSEETNEEIVGLGQECAQEETCYPVKLLQGHMEALARKGVDYIFIPSVRTIRHEKSNVEHNYGCVYMQTAPKMIGRLLKFSQRNIRLISPILDLDMGKPQMVSAMIEAGMKLGRSRQRCIAAMAKGAAAMTYCEKQSEKLGREIMESLQPQDKVLVLITRNYGISDPVLNMGIPGELLKRGCKVLTLSHLQGHDVDLSEEYPNLYWPFAQHILSGAKIIKNHPNLYAVYLTNHGCGPDTMISHLFAEIMGDKPYLSIEVDEHQSSVGVVTRIEAFLNSLNHVTNEVDAESSKNLVKMGENHILSKEIPFFLPVLSIYSKLIQRLLENAGYQAEILEDYTREDIRKGKEVSRSKEVCTFCAQVGQSLNLAQKRKEPFIQTVLQSEGAETEGMTAQVLRTIIRQLSVNHMMLYTPFVEHLIRCPLGEQLWHLLILGDAFFLLPYEMQRKEEQKLLKKLNFPITWKQTEELLLEWKNSYKQEEYVEVFGDPILLHSAFLNRRLFTAVREKGAVVRPMQLTEYLWFWLKEAGKDIPESFTRQLEVFQTYSGRMSVDERSPEERFVQIQKKYHSVTGGNIRYLCSLIEMESVNCKGKILLTPAYANYGTVVELMKPESQLPFFHFQVDGNEEVEELEKRDIFLNQLYPCRCSK